MSLSVTNFVLNAMALAAITYVIAIMVGVVWYLFFKRKKRRSYHHARSSKKS